MKSRFPKGLPVALCAIGTAVILVLDRWLKHWTVENVMGQSDIPLIPGLLSLTYVENRGAAFGILQNARWFFVVLTTAVLIGLVLWIAREKDMHRPLPLTALTLVLGGGLGNLIDRVARGYVVDMFQTDFMNFAVFNVADMALVCGAILLCVYVLFIAAREEKRKKEGLAQTDENLDTDDRSD